MKKYRLKKIQLYETNVSVQSVQCRLTVADSVTGWRAISLLCFVFITDGAGQAGFEGVFLVREGFVDTFLTHRVVIVITVGVHALSQRAYRTLLTMASYSVEEIVIVTNAFGIVGVGAWRLHPHQPGALSACLALLCMTVVLREGLAYTLEERFERNGDE